MSEKIKITVVINDNDGNKKEIDITHDKNMSLMSTLLKEGLIAGNFCGGRGYCKRCRVRFVDSAPLPAAVERSSFTPEELRKGYRLACIAKPVTDCTICPELIEERGITVVTNSICAPTASHTNNDAATDVRVENAEHKTEHTIEHKTEHTIEHKTEHTYIIAVDLGTTTIAMQLVETETRRVVDTYCAMNPQRSFGADVLSRIQAADSHAQELQNVVWKVIQEGVEQFLEFAKRQQKSISCMCIAGNTTMEHLLMGLPTARLGKSPFIPAERGLQRCTMEEYALPVYITPVISAFVGGDIAAGLYHLNLLQPVGSDAQLFIDLGTNGEMAIAGDGRVIATATAAGPAFEGGAGAGVPGSDMVAVTAALLNQGIIDETGLLKEPYFENGIDVSISKTGVIHLAQGDIRALQMAKAAVRAGIEILCEKLGNPRISRVYLAGGFGYFLDIDAAVSIGLLPKSLRDCTRAAGNTSLAGAYDVGVDLYSGKLDEEKLAEQLDRVEVINLAKEAGFEELYLSHINFPDIYS